MTAIRHMKILCVRAYFYTQIYKNTSFRQGLPESRSQGCETTGWHFSQLSAYAIDKLPSMALDTRILAGMPNSHINRTK